MSVERLRFAKSTAMALGVASLFLALAGAFVMYTDRLGDNAMLIEKHMQAHFLRDHLASIDDPMKFRRVCSMFVDNIDSRNAVVQQATDSLDGFVRFAEIFMMTWGSFTAWAFF